MLILLDIPEGMVRAEAGTLMNMKVVGQVEVTEVVEEEASLAYSLQMHTTLSTCHLGKAVVEGIPHMEMEGEEEVMLTLNMLNFLNGIIHLPFLELFIIVFMDIKMKTGS